MGLKAVAFNGVVHFGGLDGGANRRGGVLAYGIPKNSSTATVEGDCTTLLPMTDPEETVTVGLFLVTGVVEACAQKRLASRKTLKLIINILIVRFMENREEN